MNRIPGKTNPPEKGSDPLYPLLLHKPATRDSAEMHPPPQVNTDA
ncbi:MAG: hypothetical protein V4710_10665 [Verrucomicrobiota bacterium]